MEETSIHYTGYKFDSKEATGFAFYAKRQPVCEIASAIAKPSLVTISGPESSWTSEFDVEVTRFPGLTRFVQEAASKREVFRMVLKDFFTTQIVRGSDVLDVKEEWNGYAIFRGGERASKDGKRASKDGVCVANLKSAGNAEWKPELPGLRVEPYFDAHFTAALDPELTLAILAYPMLKFT